MLPIQDTEIHTWFERDRSHVELRNKKTDKTIVEWWDEDVQQAVEDGFLSSRDWHGSAYEYAKEMGMLAPKPKHQRRSKQQEFAMFHKPRKNPRTRLKLGKGMKTIPINKVEPLPTHIMYAYAKLREAFGTEFDQLSNTDAALVGRDYLEAFNDEDLDAHEYARRIGRGNLQSYAEVMRVRERKGWKTNPRKSKYGMQSACALCNQDIEFHGKQYGWIDRGGNRLCVPWNTGKEIVQPRKGQKHKPVADWKTNPASAEVTELAQYIINDHDLHRQQTQPIILNLRRKVAKNVYDWEKSIKLWRYLADNGAKKYTFEHGNRGNAPYWERVKGYGIFTVPMRTEVAKELADYYSGEVMEGAPFKRNPRKLGVAQYGAALDQRKRKRHSTRQRIHSAGIYKAGKSAMIYIQRKDAEHMWITLAMVKDSPKGRETAQKWAVRYHRKHPGSTLRLFV